MILKRMLKPIKRISGNTKYLKYLQMPVDENAFLLEAGQGKHINGNVFAFLKVLEHDQEYKQSNPYLVIEKGIRKEAEEKLKKYSFSKTKLVVRQSDEYKKLLATAKYLITDNSFPYSFIKRNEQVYLNTWHGTPLKQLGRADIENSTSIGNVQKNFLSSDFLLFPNSYTRDTMMSDYMIDRLYTGRTVTIDYPRNDALFDNVLKQEIIKKYNLAGKRILAYMPTWRGTGRDVNIEKQLEEATYILKELDDTLKENELLFVNFHFLLGNKLDTTGFKRIRKFPSEYETYDFLNVCDTLISDYSSVMLDFAQTGKDVIMYIYDYDKYKAEKGFYFDIKTLPFKQAETIEELKEAIYAPFEGYMLPAEFVGSNFGTASKSVLDLISGREIDGLDIRNHHILPGVNLVHFGDITCDEYAFLAEKYMRTLTPEEKTKTVISFENPINLKAVQFLKSIEPEIQFIRIIPNKLKSFNDYVFEKASRGNKSNKVQHYYEREYIRMFSGMLPDKIRMVASDDIDIFHIAVSGGSRKVIHRLPFRFYKSNSIKFCQEPKLFQNIISKYDEEVVYEDDFGDEFWDEGRECIGISARFYNIKYRVTENDVRIKCKLETKYCGKYAEAQSTIVAGNGNEYSCELSERNRVVRDDIYSVEYDLLVSFTAEEISKWDIHNDLYVMVKLGDSIYRVPVLPPTRKRFFKKLMFVNKKYNCVYMFKERFETFRITVRAHNVTDKRIERIKLAAAWLCSLVKIKNKPVLLYEKDGSRYEESASILYEKMIDQGYKNVRFILDKNYIHRDRIPVKYRKYIVDRFSFKHYFNLFAAKTLISSEAIAHSLEVRNMSRLFRYFVKNGTKHYVFLQHGVMYMVSLDAEQRIFFNKSVNRGKQRIVVSSKLEAQHFLDYTDYEQKDIYISGLLKFDKSVQDPGADKIVVMPTWRPWEYVQGLSAFNNTSYYKFTEEIVNSVPENLRDKLIVLPHPLISKQIEKDEDNLIWKYYREYKEMKYDDILKKTKLLITDYSSISYDAFYRGANIIFYWKEKDETIKGYGRNAHLMLNEDLAFGKVCYDRESLTEAIPEMNTAEQGDDHKRNFKQIVEFDDGKNAERLIGMMKNDGLV